MGPEEEKEVKTTRVVFGETVAATIAFPVIIACRWQHLPPIKGGNQP